MHIVLIRMQQADRHRLRARLRDLRLQRIDLPFMQRVLDRPIEQHALMHPEASLARD